MPLFNNIKQIASNLLKQSPMLPMARQAGRSLSNIKGTAQQIIDIAKGRVPQNDNTPYLEQLLESGIAKYNPMAYFRGLKEIPNSIKFHRDNVTEGFRNFSKDPLHALGTLGELGFDVVGTALPLYHAFKDREDLDTAGTMENLFTRGADAIGGLAFTAKGSTHIMPHGLLANLPLMMFTPAMETVAQHAGKLLDKQLGTEASSGAVRSRFAKRVQDRINELNGGNFTPVPNPNLQQQAINDVLSNGQDYLGYINR